MEAIQEFHTGQIANINDALWIVQEVESNKSDRNAVVVRMKLKNPLTGTSTETVSKADDKLEPITLDRREVICSCFTDPLCVLMDSEFNQYETERDDLESVLTLVEDSIADICRAVLHNDKVISIELLAAAVRQITHTESAVCSDTLGKVMRTARPNDGTGLQVSALCEIGDSIGVDIRTDEYKSCVKA